MGNTDNNRITMEEEEIEALLNDALDAYNPFDNFHCLAILLYFMNIMKKRTVYVLTEISKLQMFRRCFIALNMFIIPIIISMCLTTMSDLCENNPSLLYVIQMVISCLIYFSVCISLPFYIYMLLDAHFLNSNKGRMTDVFSGLFAHQDIRSNESRNTAQVNGDHLDLHASGDTLQRFLERTVSRQLLDYIRQDMKQRTDEIRELEQVNETLTGTKESKMAQNAEVIIPTEKNQLELSFGELYDAKTLPREIQETAGEYVKIPVITLETTSDSEDFRTKDGIAEKSKDCKKRSERLSPLPHNELSVRSNTTVKNVWEGDRNEFSPEIENFGDKVPFQK